VRLMSSWRSLVTNSSAPFMLQCIALFHARQLQYCSGMVVLSSSWNEPWQPMLQPKHRTSLLGSGHAATSRGAATIRVSPLVGQAALVALARGLPRGGQCRRALAMDRGHSTTSWQHSAAGRRRCTSALQHRPCLQLLSVGCLAGESQLRVQPRARRQACQPCCAASSSLGPAGKPTPAAPPPQQSDAGNGVFLLMCVRRRRRNTSLWPPSVAAP
jgi:hypothetical protein